MPIFSNLFSWFVGLFVSAVSAVVGVKAATKVSAILALATIYISCVAYYSSMIVPWLEAALITQFGALLGLLFPPVSGTVLAGLVGYWTCVAGARYTATLLKLAAG